MDGWNEDELQELMSVLDKIYNLSYELKNCVRGVYTNVTTYSELKEYVEGIAESLKDSVCDIDSIEE